jgi:hypothetical protein
MTSGEPRSLVCVKKHSRRTFLFRVPAVGVLAMGAPGLAALENSPPDNCAVTVGDSLLLYQQILKEAENEALRAAGHTVASKLRDCGDILAKLQSLLLQLQTTLKTKNSSRLLDDLESLVHQTSGGMQLTRVTSHGKADPQLMDHLAAMGELTASALARLAADCDLSEDAEVLRLIQDMFNVLKEQNDAIHDYQAGVGFWNKEADVINQTAAEIRKQMSLAGSVIVTNADRSLVGRPETPTLGRAEGALLSAIDGLASLPAPSDGSSAYLLKQLLKATLTSLQGSSRGGLIPAKYSELRLGSSNYLSVPLFDTNSTAMAAVRNVVGDGDYFDPKGGFWSITTCVGICLPVWLASQEKQVRKEMIKGCLWILSNAKHGQYDAIAEKLAVAYPVGSST